ncbi:MAG: DUF4918 family protein [Flavobacteriales bacterium]
MKNTWSQLLFDFYSQLRCPELPAGNECMNPYLESECIVVVKEFLEKHFNDTNERIVLFGINPGRFGAGQTGIPFTDPVALENDLLISNVFDKRTELSSEFIYKCINAFGGPAVFYSKFLISSVYPLGFLKDGKNLNYYELPNAAEFISKSIVKELQKHLAWPIHRRLAFCIGQGENFKVLSHLNKTHQWFDQIRPLPHPRWVMQYRRKQVDQYVNDYVKALSTPFAT